MLVSKGARDSIGSKAFDLYRCVLLGANVPRFVVIPTDDFRKYREGEKVSVLKEELKQALVSLDGTVAVRSSSVAEDLANGSNAGKFKTVLNIEDLKGLLEAVMSVWDCADGDDMAVIIQMQVNPDIAGVLFTRNPSTGKNETIIEYVEGMGESLVSGRKDPRKFVLQNDRVPTGNFKKLLQTSRRLEKKFGYPLDIEWAQSNGKFFILQARPITRLPPPHQNAGISYSRVQAEQFNSGPVSPLFFSIFKRLHSKYYLRDTLESVGVGIFDRHSIVHHKNYLYFDTRYAEYAFNRLPVRDSQKHLMEVLPPDIRGEIENKKVRTDPRFVMGIIRFIISHPRFWVWNLDRHFQQQIVPKIVFGLDSIKNLKQQTDQELVETYTEIERLTALHIGVSKWGLGLYSIPLVGVMQRFLKRNGLDENLTADLITGLEINKTLDASISLNDLASKVREKPELVKIFRQELLCFEDYRNELEKTTEGQKVLDAFELILKRFGHRRLARDILQPSWNDNKEIPFSIVRELVLQKGVPLKNPGKGAIRRRKKVTKEIELQLPKRKVVVFRRLCKYLERYISFRELQRFYLDMILSKTRDLFLEISRRMVKHGAIDNSDDVYFLGLGEIFHFLEKTDEKDLGRIAEFNRLSFETFQDAPGMYMRLGVDYDAVEHVEEVVINGSKISGQPISPGQFSGRVKVIDHINSNSSIEKGDIIVTRSIDPGQTHVFLLAGGLVLEVGGMLSHGAILARELNIPTVGQIKNATKLFKDAKTMFLDGSKGEIVVEPDY